jgi:hypothetical protein
VRGKDEGESEGEGEGGGEGEGELLYYNTCHDVKVHHHRTYLSPFTT